MEKINMTGQVCRSCHEGVYKELSLYDDWEGKVTCTKCYDRVDKWQPKENELGVD